MSAAHVEIVRRAFPAVAAGDIDAVSELLDPHVRWHGGDPSAPGACDNRDQALAFMRRAHQRGGIGELVDVIDAGDRVVVVMRPPAEGAEAPACAPTWTFRDGIVVEMVAYETPAAARAAVGL